MTSNPATPVSKFLSTFLTPCKGSSPVEIEERILYWVEVANHPDRYITSANPHELSAKRKSAVQNLRRLVERHPDIATKIEGEREAAL